MATTDFVTVAQAAKSLRLTESLVARYCRDKSLGFKLGGRWLIEKKKLDEFRKTPRPRGGNRRSA